MSQFEHRILVTGSRDWANEDVVLNAMITAVCHVAYYGADGHATGEKFILVSGACPTGADAIAEALAVRQGWNVERHPADWATHGQAAGFIRNKEMVDSKPDLVIAFQKAGSRGAGHTIDLARAAGIPTFIWSEP